MMIPLRRAFIVKLHGKPGEPGKLLYPEGTACAQVLITGEKGGTSGQTVFIGFGIAFVHKMLTEAMNLLSTTLVLPLKLGKDATDAFSRVAKLTGDMASELLGVGYIIGVRTSCIMMAGAVMGSLVLLPTLGHECRVGRRGPGVELEVHRRRLRGGGRHHQHGPHLADDRPLIFVRHHEFSGWRAGSPGTSGAPTPI